MTKYNRDNVEKIEVIKDSETTYVSSDISIEDLEVAFCKEVTENKTIFNDIYKWQKSMGLSIEYCDSNFHSSKVAFNKKYNVKLETKETVMYKIYTKSNLSEEVEEYELF